MMKVEAANFSHCVNIEGEPPNFWEFPLPRTTPTFSSGFNFMMDIFKPQLLANFEVASFRRCKNIKGKPQNFKELL